MTTKQPVCVKYSDLCHFSVAQVSKLDPYIKGAFGAHEDCLGVLIVTDLPPEFVEMRRKLLLSGSKIAALPESKLSQLESPEAQYLVGWSRGREKLGKTGREDFHKGSFYANPVNDGDGNKDFPEYSSPNIWPDEGDIPGFQNDFERLGRFIVGIGALVAKCCDQIMRLDSPHYSANYLEDMIKESNTTKARLLHYYPASHETSVLDDSGEDTWCGEHLDHGELIYNYLSVSVLIAGCLTGLTSAMFVDDTTSSEMQQSPDPNSGLYIRDRSGRSTKVAIPKDCLAFQTGEALQLVTGGELKAVPHFVRGCEVPDVSRNTFAVFMQPKLNAQLGGSGITFADFAKGIVDANYAEVGSTI